MSSELKEIQALLAAHANKERAKASLRYFPRTDMKVYGVPTPSLNELARKYSDSGFELVKELWKAGALEEQILAGKLLERIAQKDPALSLQLVDEFSSEINNWAVCDCLGMQALKKLVKSHTEEIFRLAEKHNQSANYWQRRLSLVLVEWFTRDRQYHPRIEKLVQHLENDKEYYVKKAVTWIHRNFAKGK